METELINEEEKVEETPEEVEEEVEEELDQEEAEEEVQEETLKQEHPKKGMSPVELKAPPLWLGNNK